MDKSVDLFLWLAGLAGPLVCLAYLVLRVTDIDYARPLHASWSMNGTLPAAETLQRTEKRLRALGYEGYREPTHVVRPNRCRWYREWLIPDTAGYGTRVNLSVTCDGSRLEIHHYAHGEFWSDAQLDHYYALQRELFPELLGRAPPELNIETLAHPGRHIPVEQLEHFTREPLDRWNQKKIELWRAGEYPSTEERRRRRHQREARYVGKSLAQYGISAVVGGLVFFAIWRCAARRALSTRDKRKLFAVLAALAFTPAPVVFLGWTTLGLLCVTGFVLIFLPPALAEWPLYPALPASFAILAWQLSGTVVHRQSAAATRPPSAPTSGCPRH